MLILLSCFLFSLAGAQTPQGFTYQALAMTSAGEPIRNQALPVRITIQSDSLGGTIFWFEEHTSVVTNSTGFFTLIVGKGNRVSGTALTFADIDWSVTPKFIKTEINNGTWQPMGVSRLWSVPFAMTAGDISGSLKKLEVAGDATAMDEALFEVKNKNGQTVFAVYNEGVRIYVGNGTSKAVKGGFAIGTFDESKADTLNLMVVNKDSVRVYIYDDPLNKAVKGGFAIGGFDESKAITNDYLLVSPDSVRVYIDKDATKAVKGGFAIGGFDMSKAPGQEYLRITNDSIRMYIDDQAKAVKGGFAIGGFDLAKAGGKNYFDVNTSSTGTVILSENRILWYPLKNAFLTGRILIENPDSVGLNSFASGFESKAKGQYSQALGYQAIARGNNSTSIGYQSVAHKNNSFAFGQFAQARNEETYSFGRGAIAEGFRSYAFGSAGVNNSGVLTGVSYAKGDYSFAIGQGSQALGRGSFTLGIGDTATGNYSTAIGYYNKASDYFATAMGSITVASGNSSTSMGNYTIASGIVSTAMGSTTIASGYASVSMGIYTRASGYASTSTGSFTKASGMYSNAGGQGTYALGYSSFAMGEDTRANTQMMVALGRYNDTTKYNGTNSYTNWYDNDPLFVIGRGTASNARANALTVMKNGRMGLQSVINPTYALELPNNSTIGIGQARAYAWATYSDGRAKTRRQPLSYGLDAVMKLNPQSYYHQSSVSNGGLIVFKSDGIMDIGLIAQEVFDVIPEAVTRPVSEDSDLWSLSYDKLVPVLIKAMQEQQQIIESQNLKLEHQQAEFDKLKAEVEALKVVIISGGR